MTFYRNTQHLDVNSTQMLDILGHSLPQKLFAPTHVRLLLEALNILACVSGVLNNLSVPGAKQGERRVSFGQVLGHS